jgi:hypothetical protein
MSRLRKLSKLGLPSLTARRQLPTLQQPLRPEGDEQEIELPPRNRTRDLKVATWSP